MIDDESLNRLLLRHLAGTATPADEAELQRSFAERPALRGQLERMRTLWRALENRPASDRVDRAWTRLSRSGHASTPARPLRVPDVRARSPWAARVVAFAAGAAAAVGVWLLSPRPTGDVAPRGLVTYATAAGQRASIDLGEGTHIYLAPESRVRLGDGARTVDLDGEASFDVAHDPRHPFVVHAGPAVIRDVGTRFLVKAYRADSAVRVAVTVGRVALRAAARSAKEYSLGPGDGASVRLDGATTLAPGIATAGVAPWDDGLHFSAVPLPTVARTLSWWFGVDVTVGDPALANRTITGTIALDESVDEATRSVALVARARVVERDHGFAFVPMR